MIGLGLIGQLVVQLLVAAGVRVVGVDPDPARCALAERLGALACARSRVRRSVDAAVARAHRRARRRPGVPGRRRQQQRARRAGRPAQPGPRPGRRHRQVPARPAVERLLREGARRPLLPRPTAQAATTRSTSWRAATTRSATSGGPSGATSSASSTSLARGSVDVEPLVSHVADVRRRRRDVPAAAGRRAEGRGRAVPVPGGPRADGRPASARRLTVPAVATRRARRPPSRPVRARPAAAAGVRRRRQLRHVDAAAAPGRARRRRRCSTVVTTSALSGANAQRKFGFAEATTDLDAVLGDPAVDAVFVVDPPQLARRSDPAGAARRQGGVRREAARRSTEAELAEVLAAVRRVRQRPAAGRVQPALRAAAASRPGSGSAAGSHRRRSATWSTPAGWTTAAGTCRPTPRGRGSSARAGTSSTR